MDIQTKPTVSVIVSVFNEEGAIQELWSELSTQILNLTKYSWKILFVNDGSTDDSQKIIDKIVQEVGVSEIKVQSIEFSRNFGHEAAMVAGIDASDEDIVICMDSDLQHPPSKIQDMLLEVEKGEDIVLMRRLKRHDNGLFKNLFSAVFYKLINWLANTNFEQNASDFFLITKPVVAVLKENYREQNRFLRGVIQVIGFNLSTVEYEAPSRFSGETSYSFRSLISLGFTAVFAFSNKPLTLSYMFSSIFLLISTSMGLYTLYEYFFGDRPPGGYTTIIMFQSIGFTVICILISILSAYFGKSIEEIRSRPIYIVKKIKNSSSKKTSDV